MIYPTIAIRSNCTV